MKYLAVGTLLLTCSSMAFAQGSWERKADSPTPRWGSSSFSIGQNGYIGIGVSNGTARSDFWKYDPANDSWQQVASIPTLSRYSAFSFVIDNVAYVGSGVNELGMTDFEFWSYNPEDDLWVRKSDVPWMIVADGNLTSFSIGHKGYLFAGFNQNNFKEYDPSTDTWTNLPSCPLNYLLNMVSFTIGTKGYIVAGFGGTPPENSKQLWEYDTQTYEWTRKADFPSPRIDCVGFSINSRGYVALGYTKSSYATDSWEYNQISDSWRRITDCPLKSIEGIAFSIGSKGYVGTGVSIDGKQIWEYTPESSSVNHINISDKLIVYPNPATDILRLGTSFNETARYEILNFEGMTIDHGQIRGKSIQISSLPAGSYILKCIRFNGETLCGKFIKQ